ncbi:16S rRNA (guanine(966)-N(2))-methyltransferase RsmD [Candidatus Pelagibacter bacterium]|nr:16S rRNA (guanine(966)-N(2))-methyltransferase RsmD [Candidatus Pelagibacter bacterium]
MRIISGIFKGKSISFLKSKITRPLKDSVKENIFNIINHSNLLKIKLDDANILDLYSGTGSFGIECISRGARGVTFVEKDNYAIEILNKNLITLSIKEKTLIIKDRIENYLNTKKKEKFDIIFLDPPFAENEFINEVKLIKKNKVYSKNHLIIIHRESKSQDDLSGILKPLIVKRYSRSKIIFGKF